MRMKILTVASIPALMLGYLCCSEFQTLKGLEPRRWLNTERTASFRQRLGYPCVGQKQLHQISRQARALVKRTLGSRFPRGRRVLMLHVESPELRTPPRHLPLHVVHIFMEMR